MYLRDKWTPMMLLRFHVGDLASRRVPGDPDRAAAVHDFVAAVAVLQGNKLFAELAVVTVGVDGLVLVEAGDRTHGMLLLHGDLRLQLGVLGVILMAVDDDWGRSVVSHVLSNVDV